MSENSDNLLARQWYSTKNPHGQPAPNKAFTERHRCSSVKNDGSPSSWAHLTLGDSAAYKLFQILVEESNRAIHRGIEVFGNVVIVAIVGIQVGDAAHYADIFRQITEYSVIENGN